MRENLPSLVEMPLFQAISAGEIETMLKCLGAYTKTYAKNQYIFRVGESIRSIGAILSGTVHMLKEDVWGNTSIYTRIPEKGVFGETFACGELDRSSVSFVAAEDCTVLFLPFERVMFSCSAACGFHHRLIRNMMTLVAQKNAQLMDKLEIMAKKTLREKILTYLSQQAQHSGGMYFDSPLGRLDMASYLGVDRSALTRELSRMKEAGLLDFDRNTFRLLQEAK